MRNDLKIKVCGMKSPENIKDILSLDIDFMGFIFYEKSPRYTSFVNSKIDFVTTNKTGVFVNHSKQDILKYASVFNLDYLQLHGNESPELCSELQKEGYKVIKVFSVDDNFDFNICKDYCKVTDLFLFDTKGENPGGNGLLFNWKKLEKYTLNKPFLLSGGISKNNLEDILNFNHPQFFGLDLNSGFEIEPGLKNYKLLKDFLYELRNK